MTASRTTPTSAGTSPPPAPAQCPVRPGDACMLCHPGASSPETCGLVYLVMTDPALRAELRELTLACRAEADPLPAD
jgi:hypothetical protein